MNEGLMMILILSLPLSAFVVIRFFTGRRMEIFSGYFSTLVLVITNILAFVFAWQYFFEYGKIN
ncbi:hypothetical protein OZK63_39450, partial [Streptomyces sp. UMAF16]|nr:hypothetical protein [Streptomyces sp. UMAF16]